MAALIYIRHTLSPIQVTILFIKMFFNIRFLKHSSWLVEAHYSVSAVHDPESETRFQCVLALYKHTNTLDPELYWHNPSTYWCTQEIRTSIRPVEAPNTK